MVEKYKTYQVNDSVIIADGFEVDNSEDVNYLNLKDCLKIKDVANWPVLYIMYSPDKKFIYVGESINVINRMQTHRRNKDIREGEKLKAFLIVYYKKSNPFK